MSTAENTIRVVDGVTLPNGGIRAVSVQGVLLALAAAVVPAVAHLTGMPVRWLLPMHWAVILAGLAYGWRAGAVIGLLAPGVSFLISGMPLPHVLPAMTAELGTYGVLAGVSRQVFRLNPFLCAGLAIVGGRIVFVATALMTGATQPSPMAYMAAALLPGLPAAVGQLLLLPVLASWWVRRESKR